MLWDCLKKLIKKKEKKNLIQIDFILEIYYLFKGKQEFY